MRIATGQGSNYKTACLLDYPYLKQKFLSIAIDSTKEQALMLIQK